MKYNVTVTLDLLATPEEIGRRVLRRYIKDAIEGWHGGMLPYNNDDHSFEGLQNLKVSKVSEAKQVKSIHEVRRAAGLASAKALTSEERSAAAKHAAKARWKKKGRKHDEELV